MDDAALKPNPRLRPFEALIGTWKTEGTHPALEGTLHGTTTFSWIYGGAFLKMQSEVDEPGVPTAIAIFGSDDATDHDFMLYFDERGVSRVYHTSLQDNVWTWWRNAPHFDQRLTVTIAGDGRSMSAVSELCRDGETWDADLELRYTRE